MNTLSFRRRHVWPVGSGSRGAGCEEFSMWFDPAGSLVRRLTIVVMLLLCSGTYLYVWCELLTPRWYSGAYRTRFGALIPNGLRLS